MDGGRRREVDRLGDLAHRRRIAALAEGRGDVVDDPLLASGVVLGHRRLLPRGPYRTSVRLSSAARCRRRRWANRVPVRLAPARSVDSAVPWPDPRGGRGLDPRPQPLAVPAARRRAPRCTGGCCGLLRRIRGSRRPARRCSGSPARTSVSPIDLVPDAIPYHRRLDDIAVMVLAARRVPRGRARGGWSIEKLYELGIDRRELERGPGPRSGGSCPHRSGRWRCASRRHRSRRS